MFSSNNHSSSPLAKPKKSLRQKFSDLIVYPENFPKISERTIQDFFYYVFWFFAAIQNTPIFLGILSFLMVFSWINRVHEKIFTQWNELWPDGGRWMPVAILAAIFYVSSIIWSPDRTHTLLSWLYGVWTPLLIVIFQYQFIGGLFHWRKMLAFFLMHLIFILNGTMASASSQNAFLVTQYEWPLYYFSKQASQSWLLMIYPIFFGLLWHQDKQHRRFSIIGLSLIFFLTFIIGKLSLWLGLFISTLVMLMAFLWTGKCHYIFSHFISTHKLGLKKAVSLLLFTGLFSIIGLLKNKGIEITSGWDTIKSISIPSTRVLINGFGLGQDILYKAYPTHIKNMINTPWFFGFFLQVGIVGFLLALWVWLASIVGFISDLYSEKPDFQWIGTIGLGVSSGIAICACLSRTDLGTFMIPAALVSTMLWSLKRFLSEKK